MNRDVRIDQLGFVAELDKSFADPLRDKVKEDLIAKSIERAAGDSFEGLIVKSDSYTVDAAKFLDLYEAGFISRAQLISAIKVNRTPAQQFLSLEKLASISLVTPATPQLRVSRIKGVEVKLITAVERIAKAVAA